VPGGNNDSFAWHHDDELNHHQHLHTVELPEQGEIPGAVFGNTANRHTDHCVICPEQYALAHNGRGKQALNLLTLYASTRRI
jgi:hypothetical protein